MGLCFSVKEKEKENYTIENSMLFFEKKIKSNSSIQTIDSLKNINDIEKNFILEYKDFRVKVPLLKNINNSKIMKRRNNIL